MALVVLLERVRVWWEGGVGGYVGGGQTRWRRGALDLLHGVNASRRQKIGKKMKLNRNETKGFILKCLLTSLIKTLQGTGIQFEKLARRNWPGGIDGLGQYFRLSVCDLCDQWQPSLLRRQLPPPRAATLQQADR